MTLEEITAVLGGILTIGGVAAAWADFLESLL